MSKRGGDKKCFPVKKKEAMEEEDEEEKEKR